MGQLGIQHYKFDITIVNGMMTALGIAGAVGPVWGSISNSVANGMSICFEMMQDSLKGGAKPSPATAWTRLVRVLGPLCGMPNNAFLTLVSTVALLGISAVGIFAVIAGGPLELTIAAIGLFFDALAYGAAESGFNISQHDEAVSLGNRLKLRMYLEKQYRKQQASRYGPR